MRKQWEKPRFGRNVTRFNEISPDLVKISLDLHKISPKSRFFRRNLGFFAKIWNFFAKIWVSHQNMVFSPIASGFSSFGGRETEIDPPKLVSSGEDLPPTTEVVESTGVGSVPVGFFGWVESPDGLDSPTCSSCSTNSSISTGPSKPLLYFQAKLKWG